MHPSSPLHDTGWGHPEHQGRLRTLASTVGKDLLTLHGHVEQLEAETAAEEDLVRVHAPAHVERVREACRQAADEGSIVALDPDTKVSSASWDAALGSAGTAIAAARAVVTGALSNAFVATRPPGHHATPDQPMGFCLFANAAIAALHALENRGLSRVAVVDFDVHHGNGTQAVLWDEGRATFCSSHQWPLYPGTGAESETGAHGNVHNAGLRPGSGGPQFRAAWENRLLPAVAAAAPELIIVSAGFDAHHRDPLAELNLVEADFAWITHRICDLAETCAEGRVVSVLEGGYDLVGLAVSTAAHVQALMERSL